MRFYSQQPEVIACQGRRESAGLVSSGYLENGKSKEYLLADIYLEDGE